MSRNLCQKNCYRCDVQAIKITGERYQGCEEKQGCYATEYQDYWFADAECEVCETKYTAWLTNRHGVTAGVCEDPKRAEEKGCCFCDGCEYTYFDLSFRSTFNDEPGEEDFVAKDIVKTICIKKGVAIDWNYKEQADV